MLITFKGISDNDGQLHERALYFRVSGLDTIKMEIKKMGTSCCYFLRMELVLLGQSRSGVGAGAGIDIFRSESEPEMESLNPRPGRVADFAITPCFSKISRKLTC